MALPTPPRTYRAYRRTTGPPYPLTIHPTTETLPTALAPHAVLIRIHATSLNYRDVAQLRAGSFPATVIPGGIPSSDCAGEVVAVGAGVQRVRVGERVTVNVDVDNLTGEERDARGRALGGDVEGVLREFVVVGEEVVVRAPGHLAWGEVATLPCAGVTAWMALGGAEGVGAVGRTALLQGTGGVSMFALVICLAAGIRPIITSSSDEKLEEIKKRSPTIAGINYKRHPDVASEVLRLTDGKGVDVVVNNAGPASIPNDLTALRARRGTISLVGFLAGPQGGWEPAVLLNLLLKTARIQGIRAGSVKDFEALNRFLEEKNVRLDSIIDSTFSFEDAPAAFEYLGSGKHVGKVVIQF